MLSACLLICLETLSSAQVSEIPFNTMPKDFKPQIRWDNEMLFVTYPTGIFYRDYSNGEVSEDWGRHNHKWEMYGFAGHEINDFAINGDRIIGITSNPYPDGEMFIRSNDGGKTYETFTPKEIAEFIASETYYDVKPNFLIQNPNNRNELLLECVFIFRSVDFGETWERIPDFSPDFTTTKYSPLDSNIVIVGWHSWSEYFPNGNFSISQDGGQTFNHIMYEGEEIVDANTIAFHYSNPDIVIIGGFPSVISTDRGETWNVIEEANCINFDFDTRGSDRLYSFGSRSISISDDFGVTWNELCQINLDNDDEIIDFVQHEDVIYTYSKNYKVHKIDLSLLETAVDEIIAENANISLNIAGNNLRINSQIEISSIEIYSIGGIKLLSQKYTSEGINISDLLQGTYIARLQTTDGRSLSVKFNK